MKKTILLLSTVILIFCGVGENAYAQMAGKGRLPSLDPEQLRLPLFPKGNIPISPFVPDMNFDEMENNINKFMDKLSNLFNKIPTGVPSYDRQSVTATLKVLREAKTQVALAKKNLKQIAELKNLTSTQIEKLKRINEQLKNLDEAIDINKYFEECKTTRRETLQILHKSGLYSESEITAIDKTFTALIQNAYLLADKESLFYKTMTNDKLEMNDAERLRVINDTFSKMEHQLDLCRYYRGKALSLGRSRANEKNYDSEIIGLYKVN